MRTLVIGDVHGCKHELDALIDKASPDRVVLVGDLFTKGPHPRGVWKRIRKRGMDSVLGNHDERLLAALRGDLPQDRAAHECIAKLNETGTRWQAWLSERPLFLDVAGFTVVHASLHPSGKKKCTSKNAALYLRRWPDDRASSPRWHAVYRGKRKVIFGHDAMSGLIRINRNGKPWIIGLDTGCVYGGKLSGYLIEEDRVIQVKARKAYLPL